MVLLFEWALREFSWMSRHPLIEPRRGEGKRWETTAYSATKEMEDLLKDEPRVCVNTCCNTLFPPPFTLPCHYYVPHTDAPGSVHGLSPLHLAP